MLLSLYFYLLQAAQSQYSTVREHIFKMLMMRFYQVQGYWEEEEDLKEDAFLCLFPAC